MVNQLLNLGVSLLLDRPAVNLEHGARARRVRIRTSLSAVPNTYAIGVAWPIAKFKFTTLANLAGAWKIRDVTLTCMANRIAEAGAF